MLIGSGEEEERVFEDIVITIYQRQCTEDGGTLPQVFESLSPRYMRHAHDLLALLAIRFASRILSNSVWVAFMKMKPAADKYIETCI